MAHRAGDWGTSSIAFAECWNGAPTQSQSGVINNGLLRNILDRFRYFAPVATCQSGYGAVCKTVYPGSIPGVASRFSCNGPICKLTWASRVGSFVRGDRRSPPLIHSIEEPTSAVGFR